MTLPLAKTVKIRPARISEHRELEALQRRASLSNPEDRHALLEHPEAIALPLEYISEGNVFVADVNGLIKAFAVMLDRSEGDAELDGLFVEPADMRQGLGKLLVEHCVHCARKKGSASMNVVCNPNAEGFYKICGFETVGTQPTEFGTAQRMRRTF